MRKSISGLLLTAVTLLGCGKDIQSSSSFINGMNVAWVKFGEDIGTGKAPLEELATQFDLLAQSARGGNPVARIWLHTDGRLTPLFKNGLVVGPGPHATEDLKSIFDLAQQKNIKLLPVLWSHDLLRTDGKSKEDLKRNKSLFTDSKVLDSYINHALKSLIQSVDGHPALFAWEVCNEPEGMSVEENWDIVLPENRLTFSQIYTFIAKQVSAIRRFSSSPTLITVGSVSAKYVNRYRDNVLFYFGDYRSNLDFYQIHYYDHMPTSLNPFVKRAEDFGADKPILVGEFFPSQWRGLGITKQKDLYIQLRERGYMGAMAWKDGAEPDMKPILESIDHNRDRDW